MTVCHRRGEGVKFGKKSVTFLNGLNMTCDKFHNKQKIFKIGLFMF